ncbi:MAG: FAD/NAD(P)-binding oxidoreductase [Beijerinckiaceae bacterium]|nr:FAD/NAD(P)-binding oxidoreductase [Beijerinckiaceae bacterium]MCZ8301695.1 FAD/NAD(P)-binding oxidoreductase [Beijerinckiaceae bacterium]
MAEPRIIIVGAGPAGIRAAGMLVAAGLRPVLLDEGQRDGGQIYRRQPEGFTRTPEQLYGTEAARAVALHQSFERLKPQIDYRPRHLAWNVADGVVHTISEGKPGQFAYDVLIIAAGATDRLLPVKGWQHAGVYSLGGAQIALKAQACAIGRKVVFLGTGPLLQLVALQYHKAGAQVVALLDTSPFLKQVLALPKLAARPAMLVKGLRLVGGLMASGMAIHRGVTPVEIHGEAEAGVTGVSVRLASGEIRRFDCDAVGLGYHLRPEAQLADLARCAFTFDAKTRQFWPEIDADGRSSVAGVYLAGDGVRTQGADGAEISGALAACAVLADLGRPVPEAERAALREQGRIMERFREGIAEAYPWPAHLAADLPDDAILCRCEGITVGELREAATEKGADEVNRAKALTRVGMGRCQGRYCGHAGAEIVAAATGVPLEAVGRLRGQAPVKPLPVAAGEVQP